MFLQRGHHAGRMTEPDRSLPCSDQPVQQIIDRHVAGSAGEHLVSAANGLANQLNNRRRFARARWPINDVEIACRQGQIDLLLLRLIESWIKRFPGLSMSDGRCGISKQELLEAREPIRQPHALDRCVVAGRG